MDEAEAIAYLKGVITGKKMTLSRVWGHRLTRLSNSIRSNAHKSLDDLTGEYLKENELRQADIKQLILLHVPAIAKAGSTNVLSAAEKALGEESTLIHDELNNLYRADVQSRYGKSTDDTNQLIQYLDAKHEANVLWNGFDIRHCAEKILNDRELIDWNMASARANTVAASAARDSAEATKAAAMAAKQSNELAIHSNAVAQQTSRWTRIAALWTAIAASGTCLAAVCTAWGIWHPLQNPPTQVFNLSATLQSGRSNAPTHLFDYTTCPRS
jgi:hypothetical protein